MASRCCPCNGNSANCSRCICARSKRPCLSCRPLKSEKCLNTLRQRQQGGRAADNERRKTAPSPSDQTSSSGSAFVGVRGTQGEDANRVVVNQPERVKDTGSKQHVSNYNDLSNDDDGLQSGSQVDVDALMKKAYGASLEGSSGHDNTGIWGERWLRLLKLSRRLYSIPGGAIGRKYVNLLAEEVMHVVVGNYPSDRLIVFSAMMLQRDKMVKKVKDIRGTLARRMDMWKREEFEQLLQEMLRCDRALQHRLNRDSGNAHIAKVFTRLLLQGKVTLAVRWLSERVSSRVLDPSDVVENNSHGGELVMEVLRRKHPDPVVPSHSALLPESTLPVLEDLDINGGHVLSVARAIQGGAGPGGCDSTHWQDALLRFGPSSERLRDSVAALARQLANTIVPWVHVRALMANRLIALDKCPGVRPVGIGEALRRVLGRTVCMVTRSDLEDVAGIDQLCAGTKMGIEGAIHAVGDLYNEHKSRGWGVLLVDAHNAFNSINRIAALWNVRTLWPRCCRFLFNTYRGWATLVVAGSESFLSSKKGVTQGDPLSMFLYAASTLLLISALKGGGVTQVWYADDASVCGELVKIQDWFNRLMQLGPKYGYHPEPRKTVLVVDDAFVDKAESIFSSYGVKVVQSCRYLGGVIGNEEGRIQYVREVVDQWLMKLKKLTTIA